MRAREQARLAAARRAHGGECVELGDGITHYRLEGRADALPLILVHGATVPLWEFDLLVPDLGADFRTLRFDLYGHGLSDRPAVRYTLDLFVRQTLALLEAVDFPRPAAILGHSLGAAVASAVAVREPGWVDRLMLVAPMLDFNATSAWSRLFKLPAAGELAMRLFAVRALVRRRRARYARIGRPQLADLFIEQVSFAGFGRALLSMIRVETLGDQAARYAALPALARKVLVISGGADAVIPAADIARVRDLVGRHEHFDLETAEHSLLLTHSAEVAAALRAFCAIGSAISQVNQRIHFNFVQVGYLNNCGANSCR
jgi:pimeloyl-ACP methyl ester carboxylesterase